MTGAGVVKLNQCAILLLAVATALFTGCETASEKDARYRSGEQAIIRATRSSTRHLDDRIEALEQLHRSVYGSSNEDEYIDYGALEIQ